MFLWTAFTIGLFGSLHCAGMCGPIALVVGSQNKRFVWANAILYNLGRIVTYTLLGALMGLLGRGLFLAGFQKTMSIFIGVTLLAIALLSINVEAKLLKLSFFNRFAGQLKIKLGAYLQKHSFNAFFSVGLLNGLLPCGLVYMAIIGALSTSDIPSGMAYMALFGLGTFPMMMVSTFAGNIASLKARNFLKKAYPVFMIIFALLFLFRGLNFNLPGEFLFWENTDDVPMCH